MDPSSEWPIQMIETEFPFGSVFMQQYQTEIPSVTGPDPEISPPRPPNPFLLYRKDVQVYKLQNFC